MPSPISINVPVDKALGKLHDILKMFFGPRLIRQNAKANAEARLIAAQARVDERKVALQGKAELRELNEALTLAARQVDNDDLIDVVWEIPETVNEHAFETVDSWRLNNVKQATAEAIKALPGNEAVSDNPVSPDWFARYIESVKDVSDADMRRHWGRLLAGEIAQPGTYSLRTLDVLRNMTSKDAERFLKLAACTMSDGSILIDHANETWKTVGVRHVDAERIVEAGLLHSGREFILGGPAGAAVTLRFRTKRITVRGASRKIWGGTLYRLTLAGIELFNTSLPELNLVYVRQLLEGMTAVGLTVEDAGNVQVNEEKTPKPPSSSNPTT